MDELQENKKERGYMEIPVEVYTGLVERSERLTVYEELLRGYNPVKVILAGIKQIKKKQKKEETYARIGDQIQTALNQASDANALFAYRAGSGPVALVPSYDTCPDPGKLTALINSGWTYETLAAEFNTDVETVVKWVNSMATAPAETKPADPAPAAAPTETDPEKKRPGRPRAKVRKEE